MELILILVWGLSPNTGIAFLPQKQDRYSGEQELFSYGIIKKVCGTLHKGTLSDVTGSVLLQLFLIANAIENYCTQALKMARV